MLVEQAAQNAAKVEEAYGGFAQRGSNLAAFTSFFLLCPFTRARELTWLGKIIEIQTLNQIRNHGLVSCRRPNPRQQQQQQPLLKPNTNTQTRNNSRRLLS